MVCITELTQIAEREIVIYGAGRYGKTFFGFLDKSRFNINGFIQSKEVNDLWNDIRILSAEKFFSGISQEKKEDIAVCIAIRDAKARREVAEHLGSLGIGQKKMYDCAELIERIIYSAGLGLEGNDVSICAEGRFVLSNFIENINDYCVQRKDYEKTRIKVCIMIAAYTYSFWNSIETIYESFRDDSRYEVIILLSDKFYDRVYDNAKNILSETKICRCINEERFDIEKEQPDILLVTFHGRDLCLFPNVQSHIQYFKLVVAVTGELISYMSDADTGWRFAGYHYYHPDYYIVDSLLYHYMKERNYLKRNMLEMGNAKFDSIYKCTQQQFSFPKGWGKLKDKKVVLWANTHGIYNDMVTYMCTFDLYAKAVFDYARKHSDIAFIVRLHPAFLLDMKKNRYWDEDDINKLKRYCHEADNLVWDDSGSYNDAYCVADGILTDGFCGVILSALPLLKPICACYRHDMEVQRGHTEFVKNLYQAQSINDLNQYLDMIRAGSDPMYEQRKKAKERYVPNFDGKNGQRIKAIIETKFFEKLL